MSSNERVVIDADGRLVVPESMRQELGLTAGTQVELTVRRGRIEVEPAYAEIRIVERDGLGVAELVHPMPPLDHSAVRAEIHHQRNRDGRCSRSGGKGGEDAERGTP